VGHVIDRDGMSFSHEKIESVLAIDPPKYAKELRSFLGLASYFRDHIDHHAENTKPLQEMLADHDKNKRLIWTEKSTDAFYKIKDSIRKCPKIFFMDDNSPVYVNTDASDYGIGAYCYQTIDGQERPIAFMSKLLS
jgi:hypothetical protein